MNAFVITRRELSTFLVSPFAYIIGAAFLFLTGLAFFFTVALHNVATLSQVFNVAAVFLFFISPLLTMRLLSKEAHSGTLELLLTAPVRDWEVVVGKFLAALLFFIIILTPTLAYLFLLIYYGKPDLPVTLSGYLGVILLGTMLISLGILASALSANQFIAAIMAIMLSSLFWLAGGIGTVINGTFGYIFTYLSIQEHFTDFGLGLIATNNIIYFLSITAGALFVAAQIIQVRR